MKVDEQKSDASRFRMGSLRTIKMPIFLKLIYSLIGAHIQNPNRIFFLLWQNDSKINLEQQTDENNNEYSERENN